MKVQFRNTEIKLGNITIQLRNTEIQLEIQFDEHRPSLNPTRWDEKLLGMRIEQG